MCKSVYVSFVTGLCLWMLMLQASFGQVAPPDNTAPAPPGVVKKKQEGLREQTIYIPFTKLREVFERQGRGVFLPYEQFQELWKKAQAASEPAAAPKPPAGALISEISSTATMAAESATVEAKISIDVLQPGWHQIALRLNDAAILSAKIGDDPARIVPHPQQGYKLLLHKKDAKPERVELALTYAKSVSKAPGQNRVSFQAPQAPVNRWRIVIPESGVKVNVQPLIAAAQPPEAEVAKDQTVVLAFVGAAPSVSIDWTPKAEGAAGLTALATVQAEQTATIDEGVVRTRTRLTYTVSRAELSQLTINVPADQKVAGVFDPNVRSWDVKEGDPQTIIVQLFEPVTSRQNLTVDLERFLAEDEEGPIVIPVVKAQNVGRQQGVVVVGVSNALRAEATRRTGLMQLDAGEIPASLRRGKWSFAYRYAALPFDLALSVERLQPRIETTELVEAYIEPEKLTLDLLAKYSVERVGVFRLDFDVPEGFDVRRVLGKQCAGAAAAAVDGYHLEGDDKTRLVVNLSRRAFGKVAILIELQKKLDDENLLSPTGESSTLAIPLPRAVAEGVEHSNGRLILYAPESLRVNPGDNALQAISVETALRDTASSRDGRFPTARPIMANAYGRDVKEVEVVAQRRRPHVTVAQLLEAKVESGVVKYAAHFNFDIRYSGLKSLRIDVPSEIAADLGDQSGQGRAMDPAPDDVPEGYVAWELNAETEFFGKHQATFRWERKIDQLDVGKSVKVALPKLDPHGVDRAWGQIVLAKAESLDIRAAEGAEGLRPIDPRQDLMSEAPQGIKDDAARAYEFHQDWQLTIEATRYKLEEVKRTSIELALVRMVVTRSNQIAVQALYRMRSARQRLVFQLPSGVKPESAFDTQPLRINGQPVPLERGDKGEYYVPLAGLNSDEPFVLELRYTAEGDHRLLELPSFPSEPAVQKVYLSAYLPEERLLLGSRGDWTNEQHKGLSSLLFKRGSFSNDQHLVTMVLDDSANVKESNFPTDGRLHVFSALRPESSPGGSLRLVAVRDNIVYGGIFTILAVVGVLLLPRPVTEKIAAMGLLLASLILIGALLPTFSSQILNEYLAAAILAVVVIWTARAAIIAVRQWSESQAERDHEREEAALAAAGSFGSVGVPGNAFTEASAETPFGATSNNGESDSTSDAPSDDENEEGGSNNA